MKSNMLNNLMMKARIKKTLKHTLLLCIVLIGSAAIAQQKSPQVGGQQGPPPVPTNKEIKEMVSDMSKEVLLNEDQEEEILELFTAHFNEVEEKTKSGRPDRNEMESIKINFEKEVNSVLTKEQQKQYATYQKNNRPKGKKQKQRG